MTRYRVVGTLQEPVLDTMRRCLERYCIEDIDGNPQQQAIGWTSVRDPYRPSFQGSDFIVGTYAVFCLRIDKKSLPVQLVKKQLQRETQAVLAQSSRPSLTRKEKEELRQLVSDKLCCSIPAAPHVYELVWELEKGLLWFLSSNKTANEALETLFVKSFGLHLIRLFPYTMAYFQCESDPSASDRLHRLARTGDDG